MRKSKSNTEQKAKYIDPMDDAAFKILFMKVENKEMVISLLNGVLEGQENRNSLIYQRRTYTIRSCFLLQY